MDVSDFYNGQCQLTPFMLQFGHDHAPMPRLLISNTGILYCLVWERIIQMKHETILDISITFSKTGYTFFCPFLPFPKVPVKHLLKLCTWCFRVKRTCSKSSLTIIYLHFLISWRQLPGEKTDTNILCKSLLKRYQCRLLDPSTSSQPWKTKKVNFSTLQSVKLMNYSNEFEKYNISRISKFVQNSQNFVPAT